MPKWRTEELFSADEPAYRLRVTLDYAGAGIRLTWTDRETGTDVAGLWITNVNPDVLAWELKQQDRRDVQHTSWHRSAIRRQLEQFHFRFPTVASELSVEAVYAVPGAGRDVRSLEPIGLSSDDVRDWLEDEIATMAQAIRGEFVGPDERLPDPAPASGAFARATRRMEKEEREHQERMARVRESQARMAREQRERKAARRHRAAAAAKAKAAITAAPIAEQRTPIPPVPLSIDVPTIQFQDTNLPLHDLRSYFLRERAALWWVSNQSDNLLCLPHCHIEHLDHQLRTALRVIGPLRGRALLSDEVGLGKTIEAGLVLKEYLMRGMLKRFLILTVPSLVDQWEEELIEKFGLPTATTNHASFRADPAGFWEQNCAIVASLHTLKQPAHIAVAQRINWDLLVIDEAHYLRNRASQAWQAVNAIPRQFLLLLTATPVQNSLEDLYNLVTLLKPGQLPSPKEFRARFIDKAKPHHPREPEELRNLLSQVMVRNTRANAGINLPPRRAEVVVFEPDAEEQSFWKRWEKELREKLAGLSASQSSLWGRLLLQTAGSSPAAWRDALQSFPDVEASRAWREHAPMKSSWNLKCQLVLPLTRGEGGVVIFTQFLQTQSALAEQLKAAGVATWLINGQTPVRERQAITDEFQKHGGALLLTHNGTEGRNLQFCHRLVNFDLPWNPMEIEQRIGRLHRLGQEHPVRIYNLVQANTLQEHLLKILQEKLNLFELVVGETGLILGDRFSSDEFAEEVFRRWRDSEGNVAEALDTLGNELTAAREDYAKVKQLDEILFAKDYESL
jgi:SNF2 family DNA or RNA helicase